MLAASTSAARAKSSRWARRWSTSTDYVFDGGRRSRTSSQTSPIALRLWAHEARGRARDTRRLDRPFLMAVRAVGEELRADDARARPRAGRSVGRGRPAWLPHVRRAPGRGHPRPRHAAVRHQPRRRGRRLHVGRVRRGDLRGCGHRLPRPADHDWWSSIARTAPANSVLRSEKQETPRLPHWREGLRDCLSRLSA